MKITEIKKKLAKGKSLLYEHSMLDCMVKSMIQARKEHPEFLNFEESYFERVTKRIENIKNELNNLFK